MSHEHNIECLSEMTPGGALYCKKTGAKLVMGGGKIRNWEPPAPTPTKTNTPLRAPYSMTGRGQSYLITEDGWITYRDPGKDHYPSTSWVIVAVTDRWNQKPMTGLNDWLSVKARLDRGETVTGYMWDRDHGTLRMWGGRYAGKTPKVTLRKT